MQNSSKPTCATSATVLAPILQLSNRTGRTAVTIGALGTTATHGDFTVQFYEFPLFRCVLTPAMFDFNGHIEFRY